MVSNEVWMGSGQSVTMIPESELFLGYMPFGPTLGRTGTNRSHLIKYSLGYALDGTGVTIGTTKKFSDYYELVPDLYIGCTAKFYYTTDSSAATLRFTARVAANDADAIYFSGNIDDFKSLYNKDTPTATNPRGYIVLEANGAVVPAPHSYELIDSAVTSTNAGDSTIGSVLGNGQKFVIGDIIRNSSGTEVGRVITTSTDGSLTATITDPTSSSTHLHLITSSIGTVSGTPSLASTSISTITTSVNLTGTLTAGDWISIHSSATVSSSTQAGRVISTTSTTVKVGLIAASDNPANGEHIFLGKRITDGNGHTTVYRVSPRTLSNHWLGLTNSITYPTTDIEMKQMNLSLGGTRNFSYQYKGMETSGQASLDINLNHGAWLLYAFGSLSSVSATKTADRTHTNNFQIDSADTASNHLLYAGVNTDADDRASSGHTTLNGKFHRTLKGSTALCPPLLPNTSAFLVTAPTTNVSSGALQDGITYTLAESNDAKLPSFAMELLVQKPSVLDGTSQSLMVDRNTYNESVYAQIYPRLVVSDMSLSANENEELKASINLNSKTVFEAPDGYVGKCYDSTNNDTTEFKNLLNFGQQTGVNTQIEQSFLDPFFFSNGSISLFGQEFLKVSSFSLNIQNGVADKRYVGQYNNRIKDYVTGQRTYEVTITALVTDRRIFDELRKLSPNRVALGDALIDLEFTKENGESITLNFDDYMISTTNWPLQDDRGPVLVDFTIMPLRVNSVSTTTHWVMQS